jgi:hypothetical protein
MGIFWPTFKHLWNHDKTENRLIWGNRLRAPDWMVNIGFSKSEVSGRCAGDRRR